jgi:hypothetical protein
MPLQLGARSARFGRPPCRSYPICSAVEPILSKCRPQTTRPRPADRFVRIPYRLRTARSSAPATTCHRLTGMACVEAHRAFGLRLGAVGGCGSPFLIRAAACVVRLETPCARVANGWLLCFAFFSFEKADLFASGQRASATGFCAQRIPSTVLLPPVVQSKLGRMLGSDHANLPPLQPSPGRVSNGSPGTVLAFLPC